MSNIINRNIVLKLNKNWQATGISTVGKAIVDLAGGVSARAIDFEYEKDEFGNYIVNEDGFPLNDSIGANPVDWDTWITLKVRPWEIETAIHYGSEGKNIMRAPIVIIAKNYAKMHHKSFRGKPSKEAIYLRDNGKDQYTGKKLKKDESSIDHVIPKSKGGKDEYENLVLTSKQLNSWKSDRLNEEIGLKLIRKPMAPKPMPLSSLIREIKRFEWKRFLPHLVE